MIKDQDVPSITIDLTPEDYYLNEHQLSDFFKLTRYRIGLVLTNPDFADKIRTKEPATSKRHTVYYNTLDIANALDMSKEQYIKHMKERIENAIK